MKYSRLSWLFFLISYLSLCTIAQKKEIIGYYPSWKWNRPHWLLTPNKIPYKKLTIINYAFFVPSADGKKITGKDSVGDQLLLRGAKDTTTGKYLPNTSLVDLAHQHGTKVMVSIGGWDDSDNFPEAASSEITRQAFAHSCIEVIEKYGFDGIDIDWEFPCLADHKGTPKDKENFTKLLRATRESLDAYGKINDRHYLLTAALPATKSGTMNFEMEQVAQILDMLNIMTYDLNGEWDSLSGHNAPLYAPRTDDSLRNIDASLKLYTETFKVPRSKVNLGVPFYAHTYRECAALYTSHKGADVEHFSPQGCFYYDIVQSLDKFARKWDDRAKAPYLISPSWNTLVSYDDEESVGYKAQYVVDNKICGLIIWEITGDYLPDGTTPLLNVIYQKFNTSLKK
jgi:chitinase